MDVALLQWIHHHHRPALDTAFRLSHELATFRACATLVLVMALWHLVRRQRRMALAWIALGLAVGWLPEIVKALVARPRPALWPPLVRVSGFSFPSGHATAGASLFPLAARSVSHAWPTLRWLAWGLALALCAFVGLGRAYLGVHWPSDVLSGWLLGALLYAATSRWIGSAKVAAPVVAPKSAARLEGDRHGPR